MIKSSVGAKCLLNRTGTLHRRIGAVARASARALNQRSEVRGQRSEVRSHHAKFSRATLPTSPLTPPPACTNDSGHVCVQIGTLRAGDSVQITFQVTVNSPYSGGPNVSNQGSIFSNEVANTLTDDPAVGGSADPTLTPINSTNMIVNDAQANEPPTGTNPMLFTVTLSQPAG